jgi:hypothetical protein
MARYAPSELAPPAGVITNGTIDLLEGRWIDSDLIRFHRNAIVPVGGWQQVTGDPTALSGYLPIRNIIAWRGPDNVRYFAMGSADALLVQAGTYDHDGISDVTPAGFLKGNESGSQGDGYGSGPYGRGDYGSDYVTDDPGEPVEIDHASIWHFGIRRSELFGLSTGDQKLYQWTPPDTTTVAQQVTNAPTGVVCMCITPHHQIMTIGDGTNLNMIRWSDSVDETLWSPDLTNNAGFLEYPLIGEPVRLLAYAQDILLFTTSALYRLVYYGASEGYGISLVAEGCGPLSANAIKFHTDVVMWMGSGEFFTFSGGGVNSLNSDLHNWVFDDLNLLQAAKAHAAIIPTQNEVWFWFVANETAEINRYVTFDYEQQVWAKGTGMLRTAWSNPGIYDNPLGCDADNILYIQERGHLAGLENMKSYARLNLPAQMPFETKVDMLEQDIMGDNEDYPTVNLTLRGSNSPSLGYKILTERQLDPDGRTHLRGTAKRLVLDYNFESSAYWRLGSGQLYVKPGARRSRLELTPQLGDFIGAPNAIPNFVTGPAVITIRGDYVVVELQPDFDCSYRITVSDGQTFTALLPAASPTEITIGNLTTRTAYTAVVEIYDTNYPQDDREAYLGWTTFDSVPDTRGFVWSEITDTSATLTFSSNQPSEIAGDWKVYMPIPPLYEGSQEVFPIPEVYDCEAPQPNLNALVVKVGSTNVTNPIPLPIAAIMGTLDEANETAIDIFLGYTKTDDGWDEGNYKLPILDLTGTEPTIDLFDASWGNISEATAELTYSISGYWTIHTATITLTPAGGDPIEFTERLEGNLGHILFATELLPDTVYETAVMLVNVYGTQNLTGPQLNTGMLGTLAAI